MTSYWKLRYTRNAVVYGPFCATFSTEQTCWTFLSPPFNQSINQSITQLVTRHMSVQKANRRRGQMFWLRHLQHIWWIASDECHYNCCHNMLKFTAEIHYIQFMQHTLFTDHVWSFFVTAPRAWNHLPANIHQITTFCHSSEALRYIYNSMQHLDLTIAGYLYRLNAYFYFIFYIVFKAKTFSALYRLLL